MEDRIHVGEGDGGSSGDDEEIGRESAVELGDLRRGSGAGGQDAGRGWTLYIDNDAGAFEGERGGWGIFAELDGGAALIDGDSGSYAALRQLLLNEDCAADILGTGRESQRSES